MKISAMTAEQLGILQHVWCCGEHSSMTRYSAKVVRVGIVHFAYQDGLLTAQRAESSGSGARVSCFGRYVIGVVHGKWGSDFRLHNLVEWLFVNSFEKLSNGDVTQVGVRIMCARLMI